VVFSVSAACEAAEIEALVVNGSEDAFNVIFPS
jgi:hypothetical protein